MIHKKDVWYFIEEWNKLYERASEEERTGLTVLAHQLEIHRYAAGMLINSKSGNSYVVLFPDFFLHYLLVMDIRPNIFDCYGFNSATPIST